MSRTGRPVVGLTLQDGDRERLETMIRTPKTENRMAQRARMLLLVADGLSGPQVAEKLGVAHPCVYKWVRRYREMGLAALADAERSGRPSNMADEKVAEVVRTTIEEKPAGATHWSTRDLAKKLGLNQTRVSQIWRTFGLKPHLSETFQLSTDPEFVDKVRDVVGVYLNPPSNAVVFCIDEKTQVQALNRTQPILPSRPGMVERRTPEYRRHGTTDLYAALNMISSQVIAKCYQRHRSREFVEFLKLVGGTVSKELAIHVILDNQSAHKSFEVKRFLAKNPRFHFHFIPTHSSWLNRVEGWFGLLTAKQLVRGAHTSVPQLQEAIYAFRDAHNADPRPFKWVKTADQIFDRLVQNCDAVLTAHAARE